MTNKEIFEQSCKIVQGIVSNPSVKVLHNGRTLFFKFSENEGETNIATILASVIKGVENGING